MDTIPLITLDQSLAGTIERLICSNPEHPRAIEEITRGRDAIEYLHIEMPELVFIDFSDERLDGFALLEIMLRDPWLLHGGIVAICRSYKTVKKIDEHKGANIVVTLTVDDLERDLPKVMQIIDKNRRILYQREIGADFVGNISGSFQLENDPIEARCYANLICNFLYNSNKLDANKKFSLNLALYEMLINAIEHGNCGITYEEKSEWLDKGGYIEDLIRERTRDGAIKGETVTFEYALTPGSASFLIADDGEGFNWRELRDCTQEENMMELHGRGILMTKNLVQDLTYNDKGNEVSFGFTYQTDTAQLTPGLFENIDPVEIKQGDTIFEEGEPSNFLYYIVKGKYDVIVNGTTVSSLSADDVFMGEMSFLLNNKRSATVKAATPGKLIEISKKTFVDAIRNKPHYALFLSRLLAQRIQRSNMKSSGSQPAVPAK